MKKNQVARQAYIVPRIEVCNVKIESLILADSPVGGGHHDAEDDEVLHSKQFYLDEENEAWQNSKNLRKD